MACGNPVNALFIILALFVLQEMAQCNMKALERTNRELAEKQRVMALHQQQQLIVYQQQQKPLQWSSPSPHGQSLVPNCVLTPPKTDEKKEADSEDEHLLLTQYPSSSCSSQSSVGEASTKHTSVNSSLSNYGDGNTANSLVYRGVVNQAIENIIL